MQNNPNIIFHILKSTCLKRPLRGAPRGLMYVLKSDGQPTDRSSHCTASPGPLGGKERKEQQGRAIGRTACQVCYWDPRSRWERDTPTEKEKKERKRPGGGQIGGAGLSSRHEPGPSVAWTGEQAHSHTLCLAECSLRAETTQLSDHRGGCSRKTQGFSGNPGGDD